MNSVNNCTISFQIFNLNGNKIYLTHSILFEGKYTEKNGGTVQICKFKILIFIILRLTLCKIL